MKYLCIVLLALFLFLSPSLVSAAAPDGLGPWADSVVSTVQGLRKDGSAVPAARSNPAAALGVAENDTVDASFYSLGFGGVITLGFVNGISGGTLLIEATNLPYPSEKAKVEVSANGTSWVEAGTVTQDGEVPLPQSVQCAKFVRITDVSNKADFPNDADGYDLDGVKSTGETCVIPTPTPSCDAKCCAKNANITQVNNTTVTNVISSKANTGKNNSNFNTGGSSVIVTGNASSTVATTVTGSTNTANIKGCCCTTPVNVNISNNGAFSKNIVKIK